MLYLRLCLVFILTPFILFANDDYKALQLEKLLFMRPVSDAILEALPKAFHAQFSAVSKRAKQSRDWYRKSEHTLQLDREELIKHPEMATWYKNLVINWQAARFLWEGAPLPTSGRFHSPEIDLSKLKKLTSFVVDYDDLTSLVFTEVHPQTKLDITLIKPFTPENYFSFLSDITPVIKTSRFTAHFHTSKTVFLFLTAIDDHITDRRDFDFLCPDLHLFISEATPKNPKIPLTDEEELAFKALINKFGEKLHLTYMENIEEHIRSAIAIKPIMNRIEEVSLLFRDNDHLFSRLDAALHLSGYHAVEIKKAIIQAAPYLAHIEGLIERTLLIESLIHYPEEERAQALALCFDTAKYDPAELTQNVKTFYVMHLFTPQDYTKIYPDLKRVTTYMNAAEGTARQKARNLYMILKPEKRSERMQKFHEFLTLQPPEAED